MSWYYRTIFWLLWDLRGCLSQRQETLLTLLTNIQVLQICCAQWHSIHQQVKLFGFCILTAPLGTATFPERAVKVTRNVISDYFSTPTPVFPHLELYFPVYTDLLTFSNMILNEMHLLTFGNSAEFTFSFIFWEPLLEELSLLGISTQL